LHSTRQRIYELLILMSKRHIIDYIPHKKTPYIIFTRNREETNDIFIPESVYEERKKRYEERINAMIEYVTNDAVCRSRMLLRYFGEKNEHNCGQCDVCLNRKHKPDNSAKEKIRVEIFEILSDNKEMSPAELAANMNYSVEDISEIIYEELENNKLAINDGKIKSV